MSKGAYIGVNGVARKITKAYIGVNSIARKIKKAYIGIGGVARPCWGNGELAYYGTITPLSVERHNLAATTVGNYALFGGGSTNYSTVDAYNQSLTRSTPTALNTGRYSLAATTVGNYALFGGGSTPHPSSVMDAYSLPSLTRFNTQNLSEARADLAAPTVGDYALFGGGKIAVGKKSTVDVYTIN